MRIDPHRGTGRTTRMIMQLPEGCIFIVHLQEFVKPMQERIRELRGANFKARVVALSNARRLLMGVKELIRIDHFVWDFVSDKSNEDFEWVLKTQEYTEQLHASRNALKTS